MTDGSLRLIDKIGNEFQFDEDGYLTDMMFGDDYVLHYEYSGDFMKNFEKVPYRLESFDDKTVEFSGLITTQKMIVKDLLNDYDEIFTFRSKWGIGAYISDMGQSKKYIRITL